MEVLQTTMWTSALSLASKNFTNGLSLFVALAFCLASPALASPATPAGIDDPQALFDARCSHCHQGTVPRAPHLVTFQLIGSDAIYASITEGTMREHAKGLGEAQRRALANHLGGAAPATVPVKMCAAPMPPRTAGQPRSQGWGLNLENTRFIPAAIAKLAAAEVPKLAVKWVFAYPGASRARSQPSVHDGVVYVGSQSGAVHALDLASGCAYWTFKADAEVRSAVSPDESGQRLFFGDIRGHLYALRAKDGPLVWRTLVHDHPDVTLTGSPRYHEGRIYAPLSSKEWASAADPAYSCCTFRGGVVAVNAKDGRILWTSYAIPEAPQPVGKNSSGQTRFAPAGAPIWNSPTLDAKRQRLYSGTGESYTSPAVATSDAVLAFDMQTGALAWWHQSLAGDAWNMACFIGGGENCPEENGPDLDIGAPPMLMRLQDGREILVAGQKSGHVFALDPDDNGKLLWKVRLGRGGFAGGVHWGMAAGEGRIYAPIADTEFTGEEQGEPRPGLFALDPATGKVLWHTPAPDACSPEDRPACDPGLSAAVTAIPGLVFAGAFDGHLRAYAANDGRILWDFDTNRPFQTVSGEQGQGGSIEADGPVIAEGHVLVNSGYLFGGRMPGNLLFAFAPAE